MKGIIMKNQIERPVAFLAPQRQASAFAVGCVRHQDKDTGGITVNKVAVDGRRSTETSVAKIENGASGIVAEIRRDTGKICKTEKEEQMEIRRCPSF